MCNNKACAEYLQQNAAYDRCMKEMWKKWKSHGGIAGNIILKDASEIEKRAIGGIVGKVFWEQNIKFSFLEFEQGLQKTRFAPIDMKEVLEHYFGCTLVTNHEKKLQKQKEKDYFFEELHEHFSKRLEKNSIVHQWLLEMQTTKKHGYSSLVKAFAKNPDAAVLMAKNVGTAVAELEKNNGCEEKLLAVLAAEISGNPHYFDRGTLAAQLLISALCFWKGVDIPQTALQWRECMADVGIVSDNIASMVHAYGVFLDTAEGEHPAYKAFRQRKEPYVITAENLKYITGTRAVADKVYVVENEMVFLYLIEHVQNIDITLLCTSGQLRAAAFQLINLLIEGGAIVYYSGDLDPEGMDIADRLWLRYGDAIRLWRMDKTDYENSVSNETLSEKQLSILNRLKNPCLCQTAELVRREKKAGYQEHLLKEMLEDLNSLEKGSE